VGANRSTQVKQPESIEAKDSNATDCPQPWLIKLTTWLLKPTWVPLAVGVLSVTYGFSVVLMSVWFENLPQDECRGSCDDQSKTLQWVFTGCIVTSTVLAANVIHNYRDVLMNHPPGTLATLGWEDPVGRNGRVKVSEEDSKWLSKSGILCSILCALVTLWMCVNGVNRLLDDQFIWPSPHDWMPQTYLYWISFSVFFTTIFVFTVAIMLALHEATVLARDAIIEVMRKLKHVDATSDEWMQAEAEALSLASHTLPCISDGFGQIVTLVFAICWVNTLGIFANFLAKPTWGHLVNNLLAFVPIGFAWPLAQLSDRCELLMTTLNNMRVHNLADNELALQVLVNNHLTALETALAKQNGGRGLGFVAFGIVINKRVLSQVFVAVASVASTVLPIIMLLQPRPIDAAPVDECTINSVQATSLELVGRLLTTTSFSNSTCMYNITLDEILAM
jgi:hypothetical protein